MNILFLHSSSDLYGSGKILLATVTILRSEGFQCYVLLPEEGPLGSELARAGAEIQILDLGILRRKYGTFSGLLNRLWFLSVAVVRVLAVIRSQRIDLIYSNTTAVFAGAIASRLARKPHLWHIHEIIVSPKWMARSISWAVRNLAESAVAVSEAVRQGIDKFSSVQTGRTRVVYNGIDTSPFEPNKNEPMRDELGLSRTQLVLGMVGRVHFWKGQEYFLRIASLISREFPETRFVMVGDAFPGYEYLYGQIEALKTSLHLNEEVVNLGYREDIPRILEMLDIFILPSIQPDPFPTVVLEAMAAALPVVATAHGGAKEMVLPGETGLLIPWNSEEKAAQMVRPLLLDKELRKHMGRKGRGRLEEKFSLAAFNVNIVREVRLLVGSQ